MDSGPVRLDAQLSKRRPTSRESAPRRLINHANPKADKQAGHQGTVTVAFLVDENGRVKDSKLAASSGFMRLDMTAQTALGKCSFHPALENGKPVASWAHVKYEWTLG
jgi:TonB family protein